MGEVSPVKSCCKHPLSQAHNETTSSNGQLVYVICGWYGCTNIRSFLKSHWEAMRHEEPETPQAENPFYAL